MARATVIIPTFGNAIFTRWAIKSVQNQTVKDIEICIICDGSPDPMVSFFRDMGRDDPRIKVFVFPKSPRTGEPYRDIVIGQTTGKIICYCSHDDLWLPNHVQVIEKSLRNCCFTHTRHTDVNPAVSCEDTSDWLSHICWIDLNQKIMDRMQNGENFFGLTFGAHTRDAYYQLPERWVTTPNKDLPTDLSMWCKFLSKFGDRCRTIGKITALCFPQIPRKEWSEQQRDKELREYFERIQTPGFLKGLHRQALKFCPSKSQKWEFLINNLDVFMTRRYW
jgi:glycosyltransferase involved in cell wall biosynthesis